MASTLGVLGAVARKYAHKIPFIVKLNHNEFLSYPNKFDQIMFGSVKQAFDMGAAGVGATIYFGSEESQAADSGSLARRSSRRTISGCSRCCGATYATPRSRRRKRTTTLAADLTGQANHLGVTIQADIIKQKLPETNGGYNALKFGKTHKTVYSQLTPGPSDRPDALSGCELLHGPRRR